MKCTPRDNNFNLLRFIFATLVIVSHAPDLQDGDRSNELLFRLSGSISFGELAVDSIFILSGFLIVKSWMGRPHVGSFLVSRILRIYPGFIAASLLSAFIVGPLYGTADYFPQFWWGGFVMGLSRLELIVASPVFAGTAYPFLNGAIWTIPYEFQHYLLVLLSGVAGLFGRRHLWPAVFVMSALVHMLASVGVVSFSGAVYVRFLMAFSAGCCFYLYREVLPWTPALARVALLLFAACLFFEPLAEPGLCLFWGYAILHYAHAGTACTGFNRLPDVSYGIYLYAWPINKILLWHFPELNIYLTMVLVGVLSILAGAISWYVVEKPFLQLKKASGAAGRVNIEEPSGFVTQHSEGPETARVVA